MSYFNSSVNLNSGTAVKSFNDDISNSMTPGLLGILLFIIVIYYYLFYSLGMKTVQVSYSGTFIRCNGNRIIIVGIIYYFNNNKCVAILL